MTNGVPIGKHLGIRECGYDELWLQDQIIKNPSCLGLGDLKFVSREERQAKGGRLDILLKDPEDDSMYEVEVMLGQTDETHIVRTIEYWDNKKRRWPQREHYAVLVAESITTRFFNVIHLLAYAIPIIGIQANIVEAAGQRVLTFTKVIDTYEEPEDEDPGVQQVPDEAYWRKKSSWTTDAAKYLFELVAPLYREAQVKYGKRYISIQVDGHIYWSLRKRSGGKSLVRIWLSDSQIAKARDLLDQRGIACRVREDEDILSLPDTDKEGIEKNADVFKELAELVMRSWQEK